MDFKNSNPTGDDNLKNPDNSLKGATFSMASMDEVDRFLKDFKLKIDIFSILFLDERGKNQQTLLDLEISPDKRKEIIKSIETVDYCQGPLEEKMRGILPMWVFGRKVRKKEIYIKISMGTPSSAAICISFHIAEHPLNYPYKPKP